MAAELLAGKARVVNSRRMTLLPGADDDDHDEYSCDTISTTNPWACGTVTAMDVVNDDMTACGKLINAQMYGYPTGVNKFLPNDNCNYKEPEAPPNTSDTIRTGDNDDMAVEEMIAYGVLGAAGLLIVAAGTFKCAKSNGYNLLEGDMSGGGSFLL